MELLLGAVQAISRRSPQGERGLKFVVAVNLRFTGMVALRKESVD